MGINTCCAEGISSENPSYKIYDCCKEMKSKRLKRISKKQSKYEQVKNKKKFFLMDGIFKKALPRLKI